MPDQGSGWEVDYLTRREIAGRLKLDPSIIGRIVLELSSARGLHVPARSNARRQTLYIDDAAGDPVPWFQCDLMGRSVSDCFFTKGGGGGLRGQPGIKEAAARPRGEEVPCACEHIKKPDQLCILSLKRLVLNCGLAVNQQVMVDDGKMACKT